MAAIDLLLNSKKDSARLHQMVMAALLGRTHLLERLVPLPGAARADRGGLVWEPERGTFDFGVPLVEKRALNPREVVADTAAGDGRIGRVLVDLRVDAGLDEDQLEKQLNPRHFHAGDQLLYLLLGYSEITLHRAMLSQVLGRIARRDGAADLHGRVSVRGATDLLPLLADPEVLPDGPERHDARDLLAAYRDLLNDLRSRVSRFTTRPLGDWTEGDFYGLFARCRAERIASMGDATIGRAAGAESGVIGCEWLRLPIPGGELSLQFEDARLCVKLRPTQESQRKRVRDQVDAALHTLGVLPEHEGGTSGRLLATPRRFGSVMTVAYCDGLLANLGAGLPVLGNALQAVEETVRTLARTLASAT